MTGGARRVGRAFALGLAAAGARVVVNYNASGKEAAETVAQIRAGGGEALAVQADVSRLEDIRRLVDETCSAFGGLDILVNSASLFEQMAFAAITEAEFDRVLGVNLKAPFFLSQQAAPHLSDGGGTIVNIVDLSALQAWPSFAHHAVAKAGLAHLTRVLARALAPDVRVNAIAPGNVLPPENHGGEDFAGGSDRRLVDRAGRPDDVVETLLWLVRSEFVTGQVVVVDGGRMLI